MIVVADVAFWGDNALHDCCYPRHVFILRSAVGVHQFLIES